MQRGLSRNTWLDTQHVACNTWLVMQHVACHATLWLVTQHVACNTCNTWLVTQQVACHATRGLSRNTWLVTQHVACHATRGLSCNTWLVMQHVACHATRGLSGDWIVFRYLACHRDILVNVFYWIILRFFPALLTFVCVFRTFNCSLISPALFLSFIYYIHVNSYYLQETCVFSGWSYKRFLSSSDEVEIIILRQAKVWTFKVRTLEADVKARTLEAWTFKARTLEADVKARTLEAIGLSRPGHSRPGLSRPGHSRPLSRLDDLNFKILNSNSL